MLYLIHQVLDTEIVVALSLNFGRDWASNPRPRVDIVFLPFQRAFFFTHDALR
jgi:hypothetical protein